MSSGQYPGAAIHQQNRELLCKYERITGNLTRTTMLYLKNVIGRKYWCG